ncbi:MAG TPA: DUF3300 domain-containing protein [Bradyrhizobium sp.]|nr:DUF3300 domain-containing protein [Bradyrhizobium sp.]
MLKFKCGVLAIALLVSISGPSVAQTTADSSSSQLLKPEQLEALVAPIALYADELLANVLAASTYPLEVVQADRWLKERKNLKGDALKTEVDKQSWDDSVKALAPTADVLTMMSDKLDWTKNLGDAVLAQQADVMDAIQRLRTKAYDNKKLASTKQQRVSVQTQESKQVIVIEQADPNTIYVPYYDPATVYGTWPYAAYPPYYFGYPSYIGAGVIAAGLAFGAGWAIGRWGNYWGGGANWGNRNLYVNHYNRTNNIGNNWQHNPSHRQGVRYNNANVQQKFGNNNLRAGAANRMDFRGRGGQQVLNPGGNRPSIGDRAGNLGDRGGGNRANVADRRAGSAGNRGNVSNRAAATNRARGGGGGGLNVSSGRAASAASARGRASFASAGGGGFRGGGGGFRGGGGRRSDIALKHDIVLLGHLANGLGYYRFSYLGSDKAYVGVIAQEVQALRPEAVTRGRDGYFRVYYEKLGLKFQSYRDWVASGAHIPKMSEDKRSRI